MGPGKRMELPYRRYSVPETVMRKYWMSREKARSSRNMVDKSAQTEWRPCVIWAEASSTGSRGRSASEPWIQCRDQVNRTNCRPATAPSTPSWSSTTLPPPTTSAPTSSTSTSLPSTDPRSPRPPPSVQVLCFHHGVSKADVIIQFPEPSESSSEEFPLYSDVGVNTNHTPPHSPVPQEDCHDVGTQTLSLLPIGSYGDNSPNNKQCQTELGGSQTHTPHFIQEESKRIDFSCQTETIIESDVVQLCAESFATLSKLSEMATLCGDSEDILLTKDNEDLTETACTPGNYKDFPGTDMVIPRYSAVPRTGSMIVNMSSVDNVSDSELSLTDSLEDPCEEFLSKWPGSKLDNRLVRGEVAQGSVAGRRNYICSKNTYAYFLFLSGEEGSITDYKVPDKLEARLRRREEEIKKLFGSKLRNVPKITYKKRRKINQPQTIVLKESESQTNNTRVTPISSLELQPLTKKCLVSKSFDSSCDHSPVDIKEKPPLKKLDRSKTIASINLDSEITGMGENANQDRREENDSPGDKTPSISLTLTVPSRVKRKDEETIDDKVARVLMQSLEEIRSHSHTIQTKSNIQNTSQLSQHFIRKARALSNSMPGPSNTCKTEPPRMHSTDSRRSVTGKSNAFPINTSDKLIIKEPNVLYEEVQSKTTVSNPDITRFKMGRMENDQSQFYDRITEVKGQYDLTNSPGEKVDRSKKPKRNEQEIQDEALLRAVLKKSMQQNVETTSLAGCRKCDKEPKQEAHSEVCELGFKFLSNEIDIDQFIAGIPLERIEEDVKRLMYKHYLGSKPEGRLAEESPREALMKKKTVVTFLDKENRSTELKQTTDSNISCPHCKSDVTEIPNTNFSNSERNLSKYSEEREKLHCHYCQDGFAPTSRCQTNKRPGEPEQMEKCVSPLDKSVATAVQTLESFLDSERLPLEITDHHPGRRDENTTSSREQHEWKRDDAINDFVCSKFCKHSSRDFQTDPQKNISPPNNHAPSNKSYTSPRPVKSCIKNNLEQKASTKSQFESDQVSSNKSSQQSEPKHRDFNKDSAKDPVSKKTKTEINVASQLSHQKEPLEVKVIDNKGNVLSRGTRHYSERTEKKFSKFSVGKKGQNITGKYGLTFDVIPEERASPEYFHDYESKYLETRKQVKKENIPSQPLTKKHWVKSHSCVSSDQGRTQHLATPKQMINKSMETLSQKSVSTMANFEPNLRDNSVREEKIVKNYQLNHKGKQYHMKSDKETYEQGTTEPSDGKKGVVIGRFQPVLGKCEMDEQSCRKKKQTKSELKQQDELMTLSKGWINFYLVPEGNEMTTLTSKDIGIYEKGGIDEEGKEGFSRKFRQRATQTVEKQIVLPNLTTKESKKGYKSASSEGSNISLPDIRSSSSSGPSSPEAGHRTHLHRNFADPLPQLDPEGYAKKKRKHRYYSSDGRVSHESTRAQGPRTRRVQVSRSEQSVSSVTSSTVVFSESPAPQLPPPTPHNEPPTKANQPSSHSDTGSCWTVTVAGRGGTGQQAPPDVEMRLSFAGQREGTSPQSQAIFPSKSSNFPLNSSRHQDGAEDEEAHSEGSEWSLQDCSSGRRPASPSSKGAGRSRNQESRLYPQRAAEPKIRKDTREEDWSNHRRAVLHVTGSAITPEEKPRVPTQSERDLLRSHRYRFTR